MSQDSVPPADYLAPRVLTELRRLHGRISEDFEPRKWTVTTPAGEYPVPPSVQALLAVLWPEDQFLLTDDEFEWEVRLSSGEGSKTETGLVTEDRAWYTVGHDEGQWFLLVDLAEAAATDDPPTYRVDHEGHQPVPEGIRLSERLADLKRSTAAIEFGRACAWGDVETVRAALEGGIGTGPLEASGLTPLHLAVFSGSVETVQALLEAKADPNATLAADIDRVDDRVWSTYFETYQDSETDIDPIACSAGEGDTPLHTALSNLYIDDVRTSLPDMVRLLLRGGADPHTIRSSDGWSPADIVFDMTISQSKPDGTEVHECLRLLYEAGAELVAYADWIPDGA